MNASIAFVGLSALALVTLGLITVVNAQEQSAEPRIEFRPPSDSLIGQPIYLFSELWCLGIHKVRNRLVEIPGTRQVDLR